MQRAKEEYARGAVLGEGTWGVVYASTRTRDGLKVAIKRMKGIESKHGIDFTALREIKYLKDMRESKYVVNLMDVYINGGALHLVLEYCSYDLEKVIKDKSIFLKSKHVKCYLLMILHGLSHCHSRFILHRDLKPANLLLTDKGVLKLADFGLARAHGSPNLDLTSQVVTRWYRAPELLFGARKYGEGVDVWAAACIFAEIILREALFATSRDNDTDIGQLAKIFNIMGTPTTENWPSASMLPNFVEFEPREPLDLSSLFPTSDREEKSSDISPVLDVILKMLTLDPLRRISASKAIQHVYFSKEPKPCRPEDLPKPTG